MFPEGLEIILRLFWVRWSLCGWFLLPQRLQRTRLLLGQIKIFILKILALQINHQSLNHLPKSALPSWQFKWKFAGSWHQLKK